VFWPFDVLEQKVDVFVVDVLEIDVLEIVQLGRPVKKELDCFCLFQKH
jgi:hypothetical protein